MNLNMMVTFWLIDPVRFHPVHNKRWRATLIPIIPKLSSCKKAQDRKRIIQPHLPVKAKPIIIIFLAVEQRQHSYNAFYFQNV